MAGGEPLGDDCPWLLLGLEEGWLGLDDGWLGLDEGWPEEEGGDELAVLGAEGGAGVEGCDDVVELGHPASNAQTATTAPAASIREA